MIAETLVENALVLTVNTDFDILDPGFVAVSDGTIAAIGPGRAGDAGVEARVRLDAGGGIVMPGLVNAHTHLPMVLFRGLADDMALEDWLGTFIFPAEQRHISPASVRAATRLACAEMLLSGTTTCCDGYFFEDEVAAAMDACGLRAVAGQGIIDFPAPGVPDPAGNVACGAVFLNRWRQPGSLVRPSLFCHAPYTCGAETIRAAKAAAERQGVLLQIHVAETHGEAGRIREAGGLSPVAYLDSLGVLDEGTLLVHCVWVDGRDVELIAASGAAVAHCPESNMKLASGVAPLPDFLAAGIPTGLGTDGCASNNNLDMFAEMDTAAKLHKVFREDPTAADAAAVFRMATSGGAGALGMGDRIGSLETGKAADLLVLDTRKPHLVPVYDPVSLVVYAAGAGDVRHVMVDGKLRVQDGRLVDMSPDEVMAAVAPLAAEIRRDLLASGEKSQPPGFEDGGP